LTQATFKLADPSFDLPELSFGATHPTAKAPDLILRLSET
jgi:hypothetical protein